MIDAWRASLERRIDAAIGELEGCLSATPATPASLHARPSATPSTAAGLADTPPDAAEARPLHQLLIAVLTCRLPAVPEGRGASPRPAVVSSVSYTALIEDGVRLLKARKAMLAVYASLGAPLVAADFQRLAIKARRGGRP